MSSASESIHVILDGNVQGPLSPPQVLEMIRRGEALPETPAWKEGLADWKRLDQLVSLPATKFPPLPPTPQPAQHPSPLEIYVDKSGKHTGPFSEGQIQMMLNSGMVDRTDLAWHEGLTSWLPLKQVVKLGVVFPPLPNPAVAAQSAAATLAPLSSTAGPGTDVPFSGAAITSLVFGITSCVLGVTALVGLPLGIRALSAINKSGGRLRGRGLAIAGIACSSWGVLLLLAIAVPNFTRARDTAKKNACIANIKQIDGAVQQWALENKKAATDTYALWDTQVLYYLRGQVLPACPSGGIYSEARTLMDSPRCSVPGHVLTFP